MRFPRFLASSLVLTACCVSLLEANALEAAEAARVPTPGPHFVESRDLTLIDASRPTAPNDTFKGSPTRTFKTTVWYPARARSLESLRPSAARLDRAGGPYPLVIYSHGFMSFRSEGTYLATHLASLGYVVAAVDYPLTNYFCPGKPFLADVVNQPGDVKFLINTLLEWSGTPGHDLQGAIDPERIAAVGLSLGGMTTSLVTFHPKLRDPRVRAAVSIAGPSSMFGSDFYRTSHVPFMMLASDIDAMVDYGANAAVIPKLAPEATLVTLHGASHTGFAEVSRVLFRWMRNPDAVGCRALKKNLPTGGSFLKLLGGAEDGIVEPKRLMPCEGGELPDAMRPATQQDLTIQVVASFLEGCFARDPEVRDANRSFLTTTLPQQNPDVIITLPKATSVAVPTPDATMTLQKVAPVDAPISDAAIALPTSMPAAAPIPDAPVALPKDPPVDASSLESKGPE